MLPLIVRRIAMALTLAAGLFLLVYQQWFYGILALVLAGYLGYVEWYLGPVVRALRYLYRGQISKCERTLQGIRHPEKIPGRLKGYYHFCQGYVHHHHGRGEEAANAFYAALDAGLRLQNDQAVAHVTIAHHAASQQKKAEANKHLKQARALKHNKTVEEGIQQVAAMLR